ARGLANVGPTCFCGALTRRACGGYHHGVHGRIPGARQAGNAPLDNPRGGEMSSRCASLTPPALPCSVVALFLLAATPDAHRFNADAFLLPNRQFQVDAWFSWGQPATGSNMQ